MEKEEELGEDEGGDEREKKGGEATVGGWRWWWGCVSGWMDGLWEQWSFVIRVPRGVRF